MAVRFPTITTERLGLRAYAPGDISALPGLVGDLEVASMLGSIPHPYTPEDARYFVEDLSPGLRCWAVTLDKALIGSVGFTPVTEGDGNVTWLFGYWIGRSFWGQGYATEAARAALAHPPEGAGTADIRSACFTDNPASRRVLEKLGFEVSGQSVGSCMARGCDVDQWDFRLTGLPTTAHK